jgi:hypothetical protein
LGSESFLQVDAVLGYDELKVFGRVVQVVTPLFGEDFGFFGVGLQDYAAICIL